MIEHIEHRESETPSRAELEAAILRLTAALQEMKASMSSANTAAAELEAATAALEAADLRVYAALQEMKASSELAHRLLHPPSTYN
jgi:hypothetical protein